MTRITSHGHPRRAASAAAADRVGRWESTGSLMPMETTIDSVGRIVLPKHLRDSLGLLPGTTVDISAYGAGLQVLPAGRTARIVEVDGAIVAESDTQLTDELVFGLIDSLRR